MRTQIDFETALSAMTQVARSELELYTAGIASVSDEIAVEGLSRGAGPPNKVHPATYPGKVLQYMGDVGVNLFDFGRLAKLDGVGEVNVQTLRLLRAKLALFMAKIIDRAAYLASMETHGDPTGHLELDHTHILRALSQITASPMNQPIRNRPPADQEDNIAWYAQLRDEREIAIALRETAGAVIPSDDKGSEASESENDLRLDAAARLLEDAQDNWDNLQSQAVMSEMITCRSTAFFDSAVQGQALKGTLPKGSKHLVNESIVSEQAHDDQTGETLSTGLPVAFEADKPDDFLDSDAKDDGYLSSDSSSLVQLDVESKSAVSLEAQLQTLHEECKSIALAIQGTRRLHLRKSSRPLRPLERLDLPGSRPRLSALYLDESDEDSLEGFGGMNSAGSAEDHPEGIIERDYDTDKTSEEASDDSSSEDSD